VGPGGDSWDDYPVGAATITDNSFSSSDRRHVVAWGEYKGGLGYEDPDWEGILEDNTFDKGAVTRKPGGEMRSWETEYSDDSGTHVFKNIVGIYSGIQRYAIDRAAQAGDTVEVLPGTYVEQVSINKSLTVVGAGQETTIIKAPASMSTVSVRGGTQAIQGVVSAVGGSAHGITVDISGFTVDGNYVAPAISSTWFAGIVYSNADGTIQNNTITKVRQDPLALGSASWRGHGAWIGDSSTVTVDSNTISESQRNGIEVRDAAATATVTDNTITGLESPYTVANGVTFYGATNGSISGNTVSGCRYTGAGSGNDFYSGTQAAGINVYDAAGTFSIAGNTVTDSDMGIYSRLASGVANIQNNTVEDNLYFGVVFRKGDVTATGNIISGSEVGILVPSTRSASSSAPAANFNSIAGNTVYGVRNDASYQTDATGNWWGSDTGPTHALNSGGLGDAVSDNVAYSPWLGSDTDTSPMTFIVEPQVCLPVGCIQQAIDLASAGDTISVYPGTYNQDEANGRNPDTGGAGSNDFNIFVGKALTIQGVKDSGAPITNYNNVVAYVSSKRNLPTFGTSAIFVQADNVTITGLDVTGWTGVGYKNNKTVESVGDKLTVKYNKLHGIDGAAALYLDDRHFNAGTKTSYVQSYHVAENLLDGGGPNADGIRISNGAGWSGDVSGRVISYNTFTNTIDGIAFVGPGGDPWDVYPVGAATITGNDFSRSDRRHVVAWGSYLGGPGYGDIDWHGIVEDNHNTFDKAAITWTPGGEMRAWDVAPQFYNVRGIYSTIQRYAINKAVAGDTVQVLAGVYNEQVIINKPLTVNGAGQGVTVIAPSPIAVNTTRVGGSSPGSAVAGIVVVDSTTGVTIRDLTVDGAGNALTVCDPPALFGVYWRNASGTIENSEVRNIEWGSGLEGCQGANGIFAESGGTGSTNVTIHGNSVHAVQKNGITANGSATTAIISGNTVVGWGFTDKIAQNGIQIGSGAGGSITGNEASLYDYDYTPSSWWAATGILVTEAADGVVISGNNVHDNLEGIYADTLRNLTVSGNTVTDTRDTGVYLLLVDNSEVSGNSISSGSVGLWLADSSGIAAKLNTISYNGDGVVIDGDSQNDTFTDSKILNNTSTGVTVQPYYGVEPSGIVFRLNQIAGNGTYGIDNTTSKVVDALSNWWGHATGPEHPTLNPTGQGNKVSDRVLFDPWVKAIEYVGDTSIPVGSAANLRARFLNSSGTTPLVAGVTVHFDLLDSLGTPVSGSPFSAVTQSTGVATVTVSGLGVGVYTVTARWDPLEDSTNLTVSGTGDSDGDGVPDTLDNCPAVYNPDQTNTDGQRRPNGAQVDGDWASNPAQDKLGDACDPDDDNDGLPDTSENESVCPFRLVGDSDGDRVLDGFEVATGYNPCSDASKPTWEGGGDSDGDGFPDGVERTGYNTCIFAGDSFPGYSACTDPTDSDGDGCADWIEIVDINGNRSANIVDVLFFAKRAFNVIGASNSDPLFDINKSGDVNIVDVLLAAQNSTLLKPHSTCLPE